MAGCGVVVGEVTDSGCIPNAASYAAVVNGLCVSGLFHKAETYLEDMVGKGIVPHFSVFHSVIKGCCTVGKVEEAARMMSRMLDLGMPPHVETWSSVISSVCNDEDYVEVILLQVMKGRGRCSNTISRSTS